MRTLASLWHELGGISSEFVGEASEWRRLRDSGAAWEEQEAAEAYVGSCYLIMTDCAGEIVERQLRAAALQRRLLEEL